MHVRIQGWWSLEFVDLPSEHVEFGWKRYTIFRESQSLSALDNNRSTSLARVGFSVLRLHHHHAAHVQHAFLPLSKASLPAVIDSCRLDLRHLALH